MAPAANEDAPEGANMRFATVGVVQVRQSALIKSVHYNMDVFFFFILSKLVLEKLMVYVIIILGLGRNGDW